MNKLQMPSSYAALTTAEQQEVCGGGEFQDSIDSFFGSLHLEDFFYGGGLVSISVTFVPMLLFRMVKLGVQTGIAVYNEVNNLLRQMVDSFSTVVGEPSTGPQNLQDMVQPTNGIPGSSTFSGMLK